MIWLIVGLVIIGFLIWWLIFETEGVYLGRRVVIWLYDIYAQRYDRIKNFDPVYERELLAAPILGYFAPFNTLNILDVATGTGRLPLALVEHPAFNGKIIGLDLSRNMLAVAANKVQDDRVAWVHSPAETLPFKDDSFDAVTCLEALEFMGDTQQVICELVRVLRPGGLLLVTLRINTRWMPGKTHTQQAFVTMLEACGIGHVTIEPWQVDYHRVWGMKEGGDSQEPPIPQF